MKFNHIVTEAEAGIRLDKLLTIIQDNLSRQAIQQLIKDQLVTVNGEEKKAKYLCMPADEIIWSIPEESPLPPIKKETIPLDVIYEDASILIIDKPKHMIVHPTRQKRSGTVVNALLAYTDSLSDLDGEERPGIVHRLDQDTSGLLLIAKTNAAHLYVKEQFQQRIVKREYEAIVHRHIASKQGIIRAAIGRDKKHRLKRVVTKTGREAETHYTVEAYLNEATLVTCRLQTGRTHQIRVHMQYIGHSIIGDHMYGGNDHQAYPIDGQALFAKTLGFYHPDTKEWMEFTTERPQSFQKLFHFLQ